ncbi:MAG: aspartate aminotransferase family protein [Clostridiales bacterium]|nr:aspartate aminotransferase family protein [Clostridiales bacterium]
MKEIIEEAKQVLMPMYNRYDIVLDHGEGVYVYDTDGKQYLDFGAGIAVNAIGYSNEKYKSALKNQIDKLLHTSNLFYNEPTLKAAKKFLKASQMDKVFFTNSGTEAVEGAIKLARKYYYKKHGTKDSEIIAMNHSFHGRSMGSVSVTGTKKYREPFEPLIGGVVFAEFNDLESVKAKINEKTCAIIMETFQGEGGIYPAEESFIKGVRALCDEKDIVLILDEIQCGMGRTGKMFTYQQYGILPDIMTSAKALGCGVPIGAFAAVNKVAYAFEAGDHGSTYACNPFVTEAASTVFDIFEELHILDHVKEVGSYLSEQLDQLMKDKSSIVAHRGYGLMQGIELNIPVQDVIKKCQEKGLLLVAAGTKIIRFVPPLIITNENVDQMIAILSQCL